MKKAILVLLLVGVFFTSTVHAMASAEDLAPFQSRALLNRQKKTSWPGASKSAIIYECYIFHAGHSEVDWSTGWLMDVYLHSGFLKSPILFINSKTSKLITTDNDMIKEKGFYKCVVMDTGNFSFSSTPAPWFDFFAGNAIANVNILHAEPIKTKMALDIKEDNIENVFFLREDREKFFEIDQWPPQEIREINAGTVYEKTLDADTYFNAYVEDLPVSEREEIKRQLLTYFSGEEKEYWIARWRETLEEFFDDLGM